MFCRDDTKTCTFPKNISGKNSTIHPSWVICVDVLDRIPSPSLDGADEFQCTARLLKCRSAFCSSKQLTTWQYYLAEAVQKELGRSGGHLMSTEQLPHNPCLERVQMNLLEGVLIGNSSFGLGLLIHLLVPKLHGICESATRHQKLPPPEHRSQLPGTRRESQRCPARMCGTQSKTLGEHFCENVLIQRCPT